ncbi:MAG: hypothetical protein R2756_04195 [Bacteroidales bacterium]
MEHLTSLTVLSWYILNGDIYQAGKFKRFWFGNNYREEWVTPIEMTL